ncbi:Xylose isomerase-like TIM barrel [Novipirellula galeiformis]|uniref:Xylose isomerase-like TIM barrel n=1 Tax=Novipirellula galeiformis TaxID=2528004 RepID=A0A5C6CE14_9BACT|nr:TIM barrel protein [Novipirellula galeiformis]TWU22508.1 Xylose isomerase-like TIM barrel [Novipirellula galeiformis]
MKCNRRVAIGSVVAGLAARWAYADDNGATSKQESVWGPLCVFAKPLQMLSFSELADLLVDQKWDGIEATVREGGQVDPSKVDQQLPKLVEALAAKEKRVVLFASDINSVEQPLTESTLRAAAKLGVRYYRMSYYRYDLSRPILPQLDQFTRQVEQLVALNRELGMTALYQNHAGTRYCGAGMWDLYRIAADQPKQQLAVAFDIRHATVEAGLSWPVHWSMLREHVGALYCKDFRWDQAKVENVPLGLGLVPDSFYAGLRKDPIEGIPVSVHMEYIDHRDPEKAAQRIQAVADDRQAIRRLLGV